jgi:hypothetical protein
MSRVKNWPKLAKSGNILLGLIALAGCQVTTVVLTEIEREKETKNQQKTLEKAVPQDSRQDAQIQRAPNPSKGRH